MAVLADQSIADTAVLTAAYLAQLKYDSVILELITTGAVIAFIFRSFLGYKRLNERCAMHHRHLCASTSNGAVVRSSAGYIQGTVAGNGAFVLVIAVDACCLLQLPWCAVLCCTQALNVCSALALLVLMYNHGK